MSRRLSKERSRRSRSRHSLFAPKPSNPPWVRGRLIFEQLENRVPPGSLLGSPLADAAALGAASLAAMASSSDDRIHGSKTVSQASTVAQDARQPWLYSPSSPAPAATRVAGDDSSEARMQDTPPIATSTELMSSVQVGLGLHLEHELTPLSDEADEDEHRVRGRTTLDSMFADDSSSRNSDPSRGLEGISIGEDAGGSAGGGATGSLGAGGSFAPSGSSAELPFWPSSTGTSLPPGESSTVQPSLASAEPESVDVFGTAEASAPLTGSAPADRAAHSQRLGFDDGLDGWTVSQAGGSLDGLGTVTSGSAVLREGDSFLVTLEREIVIPDDPVAIDFIYIASFDTTDPDSIKDAFEVALIDADGYSLVDTFTAQRDAYFNLTEDLPAALGAGVAHTAVSQGHQVSLDISNVPPGTEATLTFRLVNNDTDTETTVTIVSVDITSQATPPSVTIGLLNDTAPDGPGSEPYRTDLLTNDPTVTGTATDDEAVVQLEAQVNDGPFVDITAALIGDTYTFDPGPLPAGPHRITVRATDQHGNAGSSSLDFRVNTPPMANAGPDRTVNEGSQVVFDASASFDADDALFAYQWTFHDSTTVAGISASRVYPQDGVYPVSLTVTDTAGSTATHTIDVMVANVPPTVVTATDIAGLQGDSLDFTATFTDPGIFDTHTARIDWGDGTVAPATVDQTSGGGTVTASHIYTSGGTFTIRVEVTDDAGDSGARLATATVEQLPTGSISGYVYLDVNNNGIKDPPEQGLPNVPITLDGTVSRTVVTAADGSYRFDELPPGTYEIVQSQPLAFDDGRDTQGTPLLGSVENNRFYDIQLGADVHAVNYNFGELGLRAPFIGKRLLLASTPPAGQLLAELMVPGGDWYGFQAAAEGTATVSVPANVSEPVIQIYTADMKPVAMSNGQHRLTAPVQQGTQYVLHVSGQGGESEFQPTLQFDWTPPPDPSPLVGRTNPLNPLDVNADGLVTPQDVLILINALNATSVAAAQATSDYYLDVDGNGLVTPADALIVINHLNACDEPATATQASEVLSIPSPQAGTHATSQVLDPWSQMAPAVAEGEAGPGGPPLASAPTVSPWLSVLSPDTYSEHLAGQSLLLS
ncbi:MAG: PKD domain-containing protein, partial [Planctomycetaceae bacterium]